MVAMHGMIMNGGVDHALEVFSSAKLAAGIGGYQYFGLLEVAAMLQQAVSSPPTDWEAVNRKYGRLVPNDQSLVAVFEARLLTSPESFSPLLEEDHA